MFSRPTSPATGRHTNIVWSNGALDPWSGQGVYPPGGGPGGPMVQNVSADGSQISLMLDLGAHHLDLMFSHPSNPPCFAKARAIEEERIKAWIQEAYDAALRVCERSGGAQPARRCPRVRSAASSPAGSQSPASGAGSR